MSYEKLERDGKIAVLYSPGFGAGWYTWNRDHQGLLFDREIVEFVLQDKIVQAIIVAQRKYPDLYDGGGDNLKVDWVPKGCRFEIHEYDGNETVRIINPEDGFLA